MAKLFGAFRSMVFLGWLSVALAFTTVAATITAIQIASTAAMVTAKAVATAVTTTKAKARLRRVIVAVPFLGAAAIVYFEETDFREWKEENREGTRQQYACEVASLTAEVIDDVLQELPEYIRPTPERVRNLLPECASR